MKVTKVISGGQTGVDRLGLDVAKELGITTGGYAPLGYRTEYGEDPTLKDYGLIQLNSTSYNARTLRNIKESDGTVLFGDISSPGSAITIQYLKTENKPYITNPSTELLREFIYENKIQTLNVAGNRASRLTVGDISSFKWILKRALQDPIIKFQEEGI